MSGEAVALAIYLGGCAIGLVLCGYYEGVLWGKDGRGPEPMVVFWPVLVAIALCALPIVGLVRFGRYLRRRAA